MNRLQFRHRYTEKNRKPRASVLLLWTGLFLSIAVSSCDKPRTELKVGFNAPLSGEYEQLRSSYLKGAEFAVREIISEGGINQGKKSVKPVLIVRDNEGLTEKAVAYTHELINQQDIAALIGLPFSRNAVPVGMIADTFGIPMITPLSTHPDTTKNRPCVYRVCFTDDFQGRVLAAFAYRDLQKRRAAVLYDDAMNYSSHLAAVYADHFSRLGGEIAAAEAYTTGETDFTLYLKRIKTTKPDVVFLPNFLSDLKIQITQLRELAVPAVIIGSDTMNTDSPEEQELFEGAYFCTHFSTQNPAPRVQRFVEAYTEEYGEDPTYAAALTYDSFMLLFTAAERAEDCSPQAICRALEKIDTFTGVTGTMSFSRGGDPEKSAVILLWQNGKKEFYKEIHP